MKDNKNKTDNVYTGGTYCPGKRSAYDVWTRGNVAEAFPDIMTPLSWSIWVDTMNDLLRNAFRYYHFFPQVREKCFIMLRNGKLYYNIGLVNHYMKKIGLFSMDSIIGGETAYSPKAKSNNIHWIKFIFNIFGNMKSEKSNQGLETLSTKKWKEFIVKSREWGKIDYSIYSLEELLRLFSDRIEYGKANMFLHTDATTAAFSKMALLQWKLEKCGYDAETMLLNLVTDIDGIRMAGINSVIDKLSNMLKTEDKKQAVIKCLNQHHWEKSLIDEGYRGIFEFISSKLIGKYGHRGKNELELMEPCWSENPRMLLDMIIERLSKGEACRAIKQEVKYVDDKRLNELVDQTRKFTRLRENNKHYLYYIIADIKKIIRVINDKFCAYIPEMQIDDLYYMSYDEILCLSKNIHNFDYYYKKIDIRKKIYSNFQKKEKEISGNTCIVKSSKLLKGISACRGEVKGTVRIVDKDNVKKINKGDIIVIKSLDISWTPLFSIAGGLITELGGILSHAAIVAREYNLPAVVNVENATGILKDGDTIMLDGNKGIIAYDKNIVI